MRLIASLRGKFYELSELPAAQVAAISAINGYENPDHFIERHANWQSTIKDDLSIHDSTPILAPKHASKPAMQKIAVQKRGRPAKKKSSAVAGQKKRRKRRSKYGFEKIKRQGDCIFVQGETYRVAAAAAYFGSRYSPQRKYSVHKAKVGGVSGSRVEWVP